LEDPSDQFSWLVSLLSECEEYGIQVWIIGHIPPGKFERFYQFCGDYKGCDTNGGYYGFHWLSKHFNERYLSIVEDYQHVIGGQLFAHHHTDSVKIFLSNVNSDPVSMAFLVPGVSPMRSSLATETGANNPGLRLVKYNENGQILDFDQFYLNLTEVIETESEPTWQKSYSMLQYFDLESLSVQNVAAHVKKIETNRSHFDRYYQVNTVMLEEADEFNCNKSCQQFHFCALYYQDYDKFENCVAQGGSTVLFGGTIVILVSFFALNLIL